MTLTRKTTEYENSGQFIINNKKYDEQYYQIYCRRIEVLRPVIQEKAQKLWPNVPVVETVLELKGEKSIIIGTVFKDMPLRPSVLAQYAKEREITALPKKQSFINEKDTIGIEDESGRIKLLFNDHSSFLFDDKKEKIETAKLCQGMVVGVLGVEHKGIFEVEMMINAGYPPQSPLPHPISQSTSSNPFNNNNNNGVKDGKYIALVSGLSEGKPIEIETLFHYLHGFLLSSTNDNNDNNDNDDQMRNEEKGMIGSIVRVIFAGDNVPNIQSTPPSDQSLLQRRKRAEAVESEEYKMKLKDLQNFDYQLASLSTSVEVDVMAGEKDPSFYTLPQQPLFHCLFPISSQYSSFHTVTNPYSFMLDSTLILGTSGQEISNIKQYMEVEDTMEIMHKLISFRHLAPTAPDTMATFPSSSLDPFVIHHCPHIYFAANQSEYSTRLIEGVDGQKIRLISVPSFSLSSSIVLVDINSLLSFPLSFSS